MYTTRPSSKNENYSLSTKALIDLAPFAFGHLKYILTKSDCTDCDETIDTSCELESCPSCESIDLISKTVHEGAECDHCGHTFDIWNDGYHNSDTNQLIYTSCMPKYLNQAII